jgi:photosystem II stability/assembly factor-like uncharacterized protein
MSTEQEDQAWRPLEAPLVPSPVLALAVGHGRLWAAGVGGVASAPLEGAGEAWEVAGALQALAPITALLFCGERLLVAGNGGLLSRDPREEDGLWRRAELEDGQVAVTALAAAPAGAGEPPLLAATLTSGVMRSVDGGRTWRNASFGLQSLEATALLWLDGETALAATVEGIYRSRDGGRGWRRVLASDEGAVEALARLPTGEVLAALEGGRLVTSPDGVAWSPLPALPAASQPLSLTATARGTLLLGTLAGGLLRSLDGGRSWRAVCERPVHVCLAGAGAGAQRLYAGSDAGVLVSDDDGASWRRLAMPPVHDLCSLLLLGERPLLRGTCCGLWEARPAGGWAPVVDLAEPLLAAQVLDERRLLLAGERRLLALAPETGEREWLLEEGGLSLITTAERAGARHIWVASADGRRLWHSADAGVCWRALTPPFGVLPLAALQATPELLIAVTYDPRQYRVCLWSSADAGASWTRGLEAETGWPLVATCGRPLALGIGNMLLLDTPAGWRRLPVGHGGGGIRRILAWEQGRERRLFVLAGAGLFCSRDDGESWQAVHDELPWQRIVDVACSASRLVVLLSGGAVYSCRLA